MTGLLTAGRLRAALPHAWAVVLVVLLLGPALLPGYVLSYDMVFVPHLAMRTDFWGLGSALPRAVPSDAVVAVLDTVVPGMLLQKLVLAGGLLGAAEGVLRLVGPSLVARLTAVSVTVWNPFTVERLGLGHWPVLLGYAVVPWLVLAGRRARETGRLPGATWWLLPLGSLSASAGLASGLVLLVTGWRGSGAGARRTDATLVGAVLAANAPWLVAGLLNAGAATAAGGTEVFGLHGEGSVPAPLAALTLGGVWNAEVVPDSRTGPLGWALLAAVALLAAYGARTWWRTAGRSEGTRLVALFVVGWLVAVLSWAVPGALDAVAAHVPGAGVVRDGSRTLLLCLPVWVGVLAAGATTLVERYGGQVAPRVAGTLACALIPLATMPDAAWGIGGALRPVVYPTSWATARSVVGTGHGDALVLPFSAYRAPAWNHGRTVLDPMGRYLRPDYLVADSLLISGRTVPGEDPRAAGAARALALDAPAERASALGRLGVGWVVTERDALPADGRGRVLAPVVAGRTVLRAADLTVLRLDVPVAPRDRPVIDRVVLALAWLAFVGGPLGALVCGLRRRFRPVAARR